MARAVELISESGSLALVLDPALGRSLQETLAQGPPDALRFTALALALAAARALASVHLRGFIHRAIKPAHIFIDETLGQATLIDFGLATALPRERRLPLEVDRLEGRLAYISPEQTERTNHSVDRRSDLYSLGVSLYEIATGKLPFDSDDALELIHAHIAGTPVALVTHRPELTQELDGIILRLLAKSPDERYQTAAGLVADLERVQRELSSSGAVTAFELGRAAGVEPAGCARPRGRARHWAGVRRLSDGARTARGRVTPRSAGHGRSGETRAGQHHGRDGSRGLQSGPSLTVLIVLSAVRLLLEHGTAPMAPYFYALYGLTHNAVTNDYARGHEFGLLAIELARRPEYAAARGAAKFIYACFISAGCCDPARARCTTSKRSLLDSTSATKSIPPMA